MKPKTNLIVAAGFLISFIAGVLVGLTLTNPGMSVYEAAGTIGKVDKYRNVRVTDMDIELRNDLLADSSLKEAYKNYLIFEYTANIKMADNIQYAIEAASQIEGFRAVNGQSLERLEDYAYFLDNARLHLLEAIATLDKLTGKSPIAIRTVMNNAGNAMAQTSYRSNVLFDFITDVEKFFDSTNKEAYPELAKAHDLLFANLFIASIVNENTPALNYLSGRDLYTENESLALTAETLQGIIINDAEKLKVRYVDRESLLNELNSSEHLNFYVDSETLQAVMVIYDSEQLGFYSRTDDMLGLVVMLNEAFVLRDVLQSRADMLGGTTYW